MEEIDRTLKIPLTQEIFEINQGNITPSSIKSLLLLIREKFKYGTWIREFGDFVAHPERDRGILKDELSRPVLKFLSGNSKLIRLKKYPIKSSVWLKELNKFLATYKLRIYDELHDAFAIILFCALQGCLIKIKGGYRIYLGVHTESQGSISLVAFFPGKNNETLAIRIFESNNIINAPSTNPIGPWNAKNIAHLVVELRSGVPEFWQEGASIDMSDSNVSQVIRPHIDYIQKVTKFD